MRLVFRNVFCWKQATTYLESEMCYRKRSLHCNRNRSRRRDLPRPFRPRVEMDASYWKIVPVRFAPESKESEESGRRIRRIRGIRKQNPKNPEEPKRIQRESEESGRESKESTENLKNPGSRVQRSRLHIFCKQYCRCMTPLPPSSNTPLHDQS